MNLKILLVTAFIFYKSDMLSAQTRSVEDTAISFTIIFVENETINSNFLSSVSLYREDSFLITDFLEDSFRVKYSYPICTFKRDSFYQVRDSLIGSNKKYYIVLKLPLEKDQYIRIPYFSLLEDNTLMISRKKRNARKVDCYYTLIPKSSAFLPKTIICKGEVIRSER